MADTLSDVSRETIHEVVEIHEVEQMEIIDIPEKSVNQKYIIPGRFVKGVCPNRHGGRKKMPKAFKELAEAHSVEALQTVISIMNDVNEKTVNRLKAAEMILNRSLGLPTVHLDGGMNEDGESRPITFESIIRLMRGET